MACSPDICCAKCECVCLRSARCLTGHHSALCTFPCCFVFTFPLSASCQELAAAEEGTVLQMSIALTARERNLVHQLSHPMGLEHKSFGEGTARRLHVTKPASATGTMQAVVTPRKISSIAISNGPPAKQFATTVASVTSTKVTMLEGAPSPVVVPSSVGALALAQHVPQTASPSPQQDQRGRGGRAAAAVPSSRAAARC